MPPAPAGAAPRKGPGLRRVALAGCLLLGLLVPLYALHGRAEPTELRVRQVAAPPVLTSESADMVARRVAAAHADVTAVWRHDFRWRFGLTYNAPDLVHFVGRRPSACSGAAGGSGAFYCALDRSISLDLAFLERLAARLRGDGKRALVLLVARVSAEHVQSELAILGDAHRMRAGLDASGRRALDEALVLQGDCLTGVWARRARLDAIEAGAWARLVGAVRAIAPEAAASARLDGGSLAEREAAFARGYAEGQVRDCLSPGLMGLLG